MSQPLVGFEFGPWDSLWSPFQPNSFSQDCTAHHKACGRPKYCDQFAADGSRVTLHPNAAYLLKVTPAAYSSDFWASVIAYVCMLSLYRLSLFSLKIQRRTGPCVVFSGNCRSHYLVEYSRSLCDGIYDQRHGNIVVFIKDVWYSMLQQAGCHLTFLWDFTICMTAPLVWVLFSGCTMAH